MCFRSHVPLIGMLPSLFDHCRCVSGERRGVYRVLVGKLEGKRPLGRPRRRWEDNINMDLKEVGYGGMDCVDLAQDMDRC